MVGLVNENLAYPILDLIKKHLKHKHSNIRLPLNEIPEVRLFRNHSLSSVMVTEAHFYYNSPYWIKLILNYGAWDSPYILNSVSAFLHYNESAWETRDLLKLLIVLNRNEKGLLTGTDVIEEYVEESIDEFYYY